MYVLLHNTSREPLALGGVVTLAPGEEAPMDGVDLAEFLALVKDSPEVRAALDDGRLVAREPEVLEAFERAPRNPDGSVTVHATEEIDVAALAAETPDKKERPS